MTDGPTREEIDAKLQVLSAQTDAKFERVLGEMRTANATINATILGKLETFGVQVADAKKAAEDASQRTIATRWQVFFMVLGLFTAVIGVTALVLANTGAITGMVQAVAAAKH